MSKDLRTWRRARDMTQTELADSIGVQQTTIHAWEQGKNRISPAYCLSLNKLTGIALHKLNPKVYPKNDKKSEAKKRAANRGGDEGGKVDNSRSDISGDSLLSFD